MANKKKEDTSEQIPLTEEAIFNIAVNLREAIKNEGVNDKTEFYAQTLADGGVMSKLLELRTNPGMPKAKLGEYVHLIDEIKNLVESKLGGFMPGETVAPPVQRARQPRVPQQQQQPVQAEEPVTGPPALSQQEKLDRDFKKFFDYMVKFKSTQICHPPHIHEACKNNSTSDITFSYDGVTKKIKGEMGGLSKEDVLA